MTTSTVGPSAAATATGSPASTTMVPTYIFQTPAITTTFTPPPECTAGHLTMLESPAWNVWLNAPRPVPNTTFSDCYPSQFMTSFLQSISSTILPAFSPLVCPQNYVTIQSQTIPGRPLYIACCPSNYGFTPPTNSTPGRPAFGGTCYSSILSTSITQYDNSSSSGVMYFSTPGAAYAHPLDGFALEAATTSAGLDIDTSTAIITTATFANAIATQTATTTSNTLPSSSPTLSAAAIAGTIIAVVIAALLFLAALLFFCRARRQHIASRRWPSDRHKSLPPVPVNRYSEKMMSELHGDMRSPTSNIGSVRQELPDYGHVATELEAEVGREIGGKEVGSRLSGDSRWTRTPWTPKSPGPSPIDWS